MTGSESADVIGDQAARLLSQGRGETLEHWLEGLPDEILKRRPWMFYWFGAARFSAAPREARRFYEQAFEHFQAAAVADRKGAILSACGVVNTILYELDDLSLLDRWIATLDEFLRAAPEGLPDRLEARVTSSMFMSMVLRHPNHPDILEWAQRASAIVETSSDPAVKVGDPTVSLQYQPCGPVATTRQKHLSMP